MKVLVVIAAFLAVTAAEELRQRRSAVYAGLGQSALVKGAAAVVSGPSGVISANTGAIAAGTSGPGLVTAPLAVSGVTPGFVAASHTPTVYAGHPQTAGAIVSPGAVLVGPSTDGRPGVVAASGTYGGYPYGAGFSHNIYGAHGFHGPHGLIYG